MLSGNDLISRLSGPPSSFPRGIKDAETAKMPSHPAHPRCKQYNSRATQSKTQAYFLCHIANKSRDDYHILRCSLYWLRRVVWPVWLYELFEVSVHEQNSLPLHSLIVFKTKKFQRCLIRRGDIGRCRSRRPRYFLKKAKILLFPDRTLKHELFDESKPVFDTTITKNSLLDERLVWVKRMKHFQMVTG